MNQPLAGKSIAILVANGFDERQMTEVQRALLKAGAKLKTVSPEQGLVNGWHGISWGHYFAVDSLISEAFGSDFDMLVLPGGERSVAKLRQNPHTKRIISHFMDANKQISAIGHAAELLVVAERVKGREISAPSALHEMLTQALAQVVTETLKRDDNLMTADGSESDVWVEETVRHFVGIEEEVVVIAA